MVVLGIDDFLEIVRILQIYLLKARRYEYAVYWQ